MAHFTASDSAELTITVADLRELLTQYDNDAVITFEGGSEGGWDCLYVSVNGECIASA
jgi:hypothetical protein